MIEFNSGYSSPLLRYPELEDWPDDTVEKKFTFSYLIPR